MKIAHWPTPIPVDASLKRLLAGNWEYYKKGLYNERMGSGVGAAAYYRRIVEVEIEDLLTELVEVSGPDFAASVEAVRDSRRASDKIQAVMGLLPDSLWIGGHNPLKILYDHLSVDLHERTDQQCLEMASQVRLVLEHLAHEIRGRARRRREVSDALERLRRTQG